jgi:hypothetical protein
MLAAQRKDGFAVRFQFAARPARAFVFGLWLQIHICFFSANNSVRRLRNCCATVAQRAPRGASL